MLVRVRQGSPKTQDEAEGADIWVVGDSGAEADRLPANALLDVTEGLEIGTWYTASAVREALTRLGSRPEPIWTTVSVEHEGVDGDWTVAMEVDQYEAVLVLARSVIQHLARQYDLETISLRLE
jgi:hypothetical protein